MVDRKRMMNPANMGILYPILQENSSWVWSRAWGDEKEERAALTCVLTDQWRNWQSAGRMPWTRTWCRDRRSPCSGRGVVPPPSADPDSRWLSWLKISPSVELNRSKRKEKEGTILHSNDPLVRFNSAPWLMNIVAGVVVVMIVVATESLKRCFDSFGCRISYKNSGIIGTGNECYLLCSSPES